MSKSQLEEVREQIASLILGNATYIGGYRETEVRSESLKKADQILSLDSIQIKDEDQSLPEGIYTYNCQGDALEQLLKKMSKAGFVKCLKKGGEDADK